MNPTDVTIWLAFFAGILSFVSPCMLPLYPSYLSYITGISVQEIRTERAGIWLRKSSVIHTFFFILGFSVIFFALGLSASFIGRVFFQYQLWIQVIGGLIIFTMGLFMTGWMKNSWLMREKRFELRRKPLGYVGSLLIGVVFAAGWTPCIGPILTALLMLSAANPAQGVWMIVSYIVGFSIPFFLMALFMGRLKWLQQRSLLVMKLGGGVMMLVGILLMTDQMTRITVWLIQLFGGFISF